MKKILHLGLACLLLSCLPILSVWAVPQTQSLNTVILPISNQSNVEVKKALSKGFTEILIRLTGNTRVTTLPPIKFAAAHARQYVQYYRYISKKDNAFTTTKRYLQINFNIQALQRLLTEVNIPIWSQGNRPTILVWIKTTQDHFIQFLSSVTNNQISSTVRALSTEYGLPILLPEMDLQDIQLSGELEDHKAQTLYNSASNFDTIKKYMNRYGVNAMLIGNISENITVHQSKGQWQLLFMHETYQWSNTGENLTNVIEKAFKNAVDILVKSTLYDQANLQGKTIFLRILNVDTLETYIQLSKYIKQFHTVKHVSLETLSKKSITLKVTLKSPALNGLIEYLNKNRNLHLITQNNKLAHNKQKNINDINPILYYDYGETITTQY